MTENKLNRRSALKLAGAAAALVAGQKLVQGGKASGPKGSSTHSWAMVIDQDKCVGCGQCTLACRAHNDVNPDISWNKVMEDGKLGERTIYLARPCMHCGDATCVQVCPVGASYYRPDGIVMMDYDLCIGCRYCEVACAYGARSFNWEAYTGPNPSVPEWGTPEIERRPRGVVEKCSFCFHRIDRGIAGGLVPGTHSDATPACVVACPVHARIFGDLNDPHSDVSQLLATRASYRIKEDLGTKPRVYYLTAQPKEAA